MSRLTLVLGGARSGKSAHALRLAEGAGGPVLFVATGLAVDAEMRQRIARHRAQRPPHWRTLECPRGLGPALRAHAGPAAVVLVDCLSALVANVLLHAGEPQAEAAVAEEVESLLAALRDLGRTAIVVSNEVGLGLVPPYPLGRHYRDLLGWANQRAAAAADTVTLLVAGLAVGLK